MWAIDALDLASLELDLHVLRNYDGEKLLHASDTGQPREFALVRLDHARFGRRDLPRELTGHAQVVFPLPERVFDSIHVPATGIQPSLISMPALRSAGCEDASHRG